ncbi:MAG: flavin reductase family protein [Candidatus Methanomethylicaceae archaeon]|nr:flavin reductase family protein [Candidatus Verstraetearchaeota archaeon]
MSGWIFGLEHLYHRLLSPRIPVIVVALRDDNVPNAMVAAWHMPVSSNPPILALSIAPDRLTHQLIEKRGEFTVNIPPPSFLEKIKIAGSISGRIHDKSKLFKFVQGASIKTPIIDESMGAIECRLHRILEVGDHSIILGDVLAARAKNFKEVWLSSPLMHLGGTKYVKFEDL